MSRTVIERDSPARGYVGGRIAATPTGDPSILALEAWHLLSARTRHCLEQLSDEANPASTVAEVAIESIHLSDLAKLQLKDVIRVPNLGRTCLCELALVMERYGWSFDSPDLLARNIFDHPVFTGLPTLLAKVDRAAEKRRAAFERGCAMLDVSRKERLTAREVGERFGVSTAMAQVSMHDARHGLDRRARFPLP